MTTTKERRELRRLRRLAAHLRTPKGAFVGFPGDLSRWAGETFPDWNEDKRPWEDTADILESLAHGGRAVRKPRGWDARPLDTKDEPGPFRAADFLDRFSGPTDESRKLKAEYKRGFAAGVSSTNTERAELRAQVEALTARLRGKRRG